MEEEEEVGVMQEAEEAEEEGDVQEVQEVEGTSTLQQSSQAEVQEIQTKIQEVRVKEENAGTKRKVEDVKGDWMSEARCSKKIRVEGTHRLQIAESEKVSHRVIIPMKQSLTCMAARTAASVLNAFFQDTIVNKSRPHSPSPTTSPHQTSRPLSRL